MRTVADRLHALRRPRAGLARALALCGVLAGCGGGAGGGAAADGAAELTQSAAAGVSTDRTGSAASTPSSASPTTTSTATTANTAGTIAAPESGATAGASDALVPAVPSAPGMAGTTAGSAGGASDAAASAVGCDAPASGAAGSAGVDVGAAAAGAAAAADATADTAFAGGLLRAVCRDLWLDAGYAVADEAAVIAAYGQATRRVQEVFGRSVDGWPIVVMCRTPACVRRYTGSDGRNMTLYPGARAPDGGFVAGARTVTIVTAPTPQWLEQILAHEFSHHELYGRLVGRLERVPPWFNEGLATLVGRVPDCVPMPASPVPLASLVDQSQWNLYTASHPEVALDVYCAAARELDAWVVAHGRAELLRLIGDIAAGAVFADRYGPMYLDRAPTQLVQAL